MNLALFVVKPLFILSQNFDYRDADATVFRGSKWCYSIVVVFANYFAGVLHMSFCDRLCPRMSMCVLLCVHELECMCLCL